MLSKHHACSHLVLHESIHAPVVMVQNARIQRVLDFLKEPSQLSDKDLAAKVCLCTFPMPPFSRHVAVPCNVQIVSQRSARLLPKC